MVIYSVTVAVDRDIEGDWLSWMADVHIPEVMKSGCFTGYEMLKVLEPTGDERRASYRVRYQCESLKVLKHYQDEYAPTLQKDHLERYMGKFEATRKILERID